MNQVKSRDCPTDFSIKNTCCFVRGTGGFAMAANVVGCSYRKARWNISRTEQVVRTTCRPVVRITSFVLHFTSVSVSNYTAADTTISVLNIPRCRCIFANSWSWKNTVLSFLFANKHSNGISYLLTSTKLFRSFVVLSEIIA